VSYDVVIRGGTVVDGTGASPFRADVAVVDGRVAAVGEVVEPGARELDATDRFVTPGFVDIHTHLDAQLAWDAIGSSSCWHGVTSVVLGNCGVTFAPCRPADRRYLAELMESVEDIPADSITGGLPWNWESYGEYLSFLDDLPKGINAGGMVGHCAVRYHAMGERGLDEEPADSRDVAAMCSLVEEAIESGALGFSTSRTALHRVPDGRAVPGTYADEAELMAIASVLGDAGRGVFEAAPRLGEEHDPELGATVAEVAMLARLSQETGRPVTFGFSQTKRRPALHTKVLDAVARAGAGGAPVRPQTTARGIGLLFGLVHRTPFDVHPAWMALRGLTLAERLGALADPATRAELIAGAESVPTIPPDELFVLPEGDARYDLGHEDSLAGHAGRLGISPAAAFVNLALEREGRFLVNWPFLNDDMGAVERMLCDPAVVMGLADAGAHVGLIMDSSQPTFLLTHWVRDRKLFSIEEGVRRLTSDTAGLFGLADRGVLRPDAHADMNVIDLAGMRLPQPEYVRDFPGGAGRYVQRASGYDWTLVNGEVFMQGGVHTGALAGEVLRS
jgi:N-acyl-D-amino-acid deacylase